MKFLVLFLIENSQFSFCILKFRENSRSTSFFLNLQNGIEKSFEIAGVSVSKLRSQ